MNLFLDQIFLTSLLYMRETWMSRLILQFLVEGFSSFNLNGFCYSYAWPWSLCEIRIPFCMGLVSRKHCRFLIMSLTGFTSLCVLLPFPLATIYLSLCSVFGSISFNIDEIISINQSGYVFAFGDLTSIIRTG